MTVTETVTEAEGVTVAVPVIGSAAEAITAAGEYAASVAAGAIERDRSGTVPARELAALDASGLLGITVPRGYGGADLPAAVLAEVVRVIAAVDPAIAQVPQSHFPFVDVVAVLGTPSQRQRLLGDVLAGARFAVFDDVPVDPCLVIPYQQAFEAPQQFGARTQLVHAAIEVGIAGGALRDAGEFVRTRARPFFEAARAGWAHSAAQDPHTIHRYGQLAAKVASDLFSLSGASAADERYDLSRHWRNARTHGSHDPVAWKYHHVGNYLLNGTLPPNHGQL